MHSSPPNSSTAPNPARFRFDLHELAGAFGDIGTDLPLLVGLVVTCKLDPVSVFTIFGCLQIATGLLYRLPMPVQPLKAMAAIMLAQRLSPGVLAGGGLVIGAAMLVLVGTGLLEKITRLVPLVAVRGIQLGLGLSLATLALKDYAAKDGAPGYALAAVAMILLLALRRQRKVPGPLVVLALGAAYALLWRSSSPVHATEFASRLPVFRIPTSEELAQGALLLALPQLPLSLGNSVIATSQTTRDLFPDRPVSVRKIGLTYGMMNLIGPLFGGVPICHGCGGLVGFHAFGARSGTAPVIYGLLYLVVGVGFGSHFDTVLRIFPMPILGVVLLFEAMALMSLVRDVTADKTRIWIVLAVAVSVIALPYGYVIGLVGGTALWWAAQRGWFGAPTEG